ncbi:MAG: fused MFS/spermidine synthase [Bacteroidota bacterium]
MEDTQPHNTALTGAHKTYLLWTAFVVGMSVMAIEMAASRLLTPHFGSSLYIWTNIIGVIMLALTVGYYLGGQMADRYTSPRFLYLAILAAGTYLFAMAFLAEATIRATLGLVSEHPLSIFFVSLLSTLPLFVIPFIFLGMVTPYIIKLRWQQANSIGTDTGTAAACSTLGSIVGTFLPVFVSIPFLGTRRTIACFGTLLILTALLGLLYTSRVHMHENEA